MQNVLQGLLWSKMLVYLDDVIVVGRDFAEHRESERSVRALSGAQSQTKARKM